MGAFGLIRYVTRRCERINKAKGDQQSPRRIKNIMRMRRNVRWLNLIIQLE
jgi:hypothetical protein